MELQSAKIGEADLGRFAVNDGTGSPADPSEAIVPILKDVNGYLQLIGTGFFITNTGVIATAKHVLMDVLDDTGKQEYPIGIIQFVKPDSYLLRPILRCTCNTVADVGIAIAAPMKHNKSGNQLLNKVLTLTLRTPQIGELVFTYAYPNTVHSINEKQKQDLYFTPRFYEGTISNFFPNGRDRTFLPSPCYQTSITIHGGASGGPVFDATGAVCGINSTGFAGMHDISFISRVNELFPLEVTDVKLREDGAPENVLVHQLVQMGHVLLR